MPYSNSPLVNLTVVMKGLQSKYMKFPFFMLHPGLIFEEIVDFTLIIARITFLF